MPLRSAALESCLYPFSGDVSLMLKKLHLSFHGRIIDFQMYRSPVAAVWVAISQKGRFLRECRRSDGVIRGHSEPVAVRLIYDHRIEEYY
jgi:hypothetical protein